MRYNINTTFMYRVVIHYRRNDGEHCIYKENLYKQRRPVLVERTFVYTKADIDRYLSFRSYLTCGWMMYGIKGARDGV